LETAPGEIRAKLNFESITNGADVPTWTPARNIGMESNPTKCAWSAGVAGAVAEKPCNGFPETTLHAAAERLWKLKFSKLFTRRKSLVPRNGINRDETTQMDAKAQIAP
jgi:hypothetical protein